MIRIIGLGKQFEQRWLFESLDLDIAGGESVAIMGESGSGKSTLLNLMAGLDDADHGRIEFDDGHGTTVDVTQLDDDARSRLRRQRIGFVFQAFHVLPYLTARQNVELPLLLQGVDAGSRATASQAMLESVGLGARQSAYGNQLSGGELQRVALARALVHRPDIVLADEPTGNLDPRRADDVLALLRETARSTGSSLVLVTHSQRAAAFCDRSLVLVDGRLVSA
ncbi:ABC transporter ATP-binding protein [soil metagenome]